MRTFPLLLAGPSVLAAGLFIACRSPSPGSQSGAGGDIPASARIPLSVDEVLAHNDETQFSIALSNLIFAREDSVGYGGLTAAERIISCLIGLETEVNSGGFSQYFLNSTGDHVGDAPAALRTLGAPKVAALVEQAIAVLPAAPSPDQAARAGQVAALSDQARARLELLDKEFYRYPEPLAQLSRSFVLAHRSEFLLPPNAGGSLIPSH
jgi:hypothetical protein